MFSDVPSADNEIFQQFDVNGDGKGGVAVFLYEDKSQTAKAFNEIQGGFGNESVSLSEIGSIAAGVALSGASAHDIVFVRCHAVAHVRMFVSDPDAVIAYMKRLDARLEDVACRE